MSKTLILAEKPSVARDIASVLGRPARKEGFMEVEKYIVTWALGHLAELAEPEDYDPRLKKWSLDSLPIIPEGFLIKPNNKTIAHFKLLKRLLNRKDVKMVINACDAAREGELIFRYIYYLARCSKPFKRLWLSENTPAAVQKAFDNLLEGSVMDALAAAAMARSQADWLVGLNATRAFTKVHKCFYSVGRVQTPALALLVNREKEIRAFIPQVYYELWGIFVAPDGKTYRGRWFQGDIKTFVNAGQAESIKQKVVHKAGNVISAENNTLVHPAPALYNLNDLQRDANTRYGLPASGTLELAQSLYEKKKLLTYPRTESRHLTQMMVETLSERLEALAAHRDYQLIINSDSFGEITAEAVDDHKVSDHHAIIPTAACPDFTKLSDGEQLIYDLVARRFLANFFPPAVDEKMIVITAVEEHTFISTAITEKEPGWRRVYAGEAKPADDEEKLPELHPGAEVQMSDAQVIEKKTKPPSRYTDSSLLAVLEDIGRLIPDGEMKKTIKQAGGLGTPATRAAIIERLIQVGYVRREGKKLIPTEKGESLIDVAPDEIKSPELTARWEGCLKEIEQGKAAPDRFISDIKALVVKIIEEATAGSLRA